LILYQYQSVTILLKLIEHCGIKLTCFKQRQMTQCDQSQLHSQSIAILFYFCFFVHQKVLLVWYLLFIVKH
jgi:hypothetical protein